MDTAALTSAIDELASVDPAELADPDTVATLWRARVRLDAALSAVLGAFQDSGAFGADGSRSAAAWSAAHCHLSPREARRSVRLGHTMAQMPMFAAAHRAGDLSASYLEVAAQGLAPRCVEAFGRDEAMLVAQADVLSFADFSRAMAYWVQLADPEGTEERAEEVRARRDVSLAQSVFGTWMVSRIAEIPQSRSPKFPSCPGGGEGWLSVGQLWTITSLPTSSATATGSSQHGHEPPMPTLRMKVVQSMQRCSPRARAPQVSHS